MNFALNAAVQSNAVAVFSLEMPMSNCIENAFQKPVDMSRLRTSILLNTSWLSKSLGRLVKPIIDDTPGISPMQMRANVDCDGHDIKIRLLIICN